MPGSTIRRSSGPSQFTREPVNISRRERLAGVNAASLLLEQGGLQAHVVEKRWSRRNHMLVAASDFYGGGVALRTADAESKRFKALQTQPVEEILIDALKMAREGPPAR